jgi:hypothetical protein
MNFLKEVFSDGGTGSASRVLTLAHSSAAVYCLIHVTRLHGVLPDATTMMGLGGFATVHYAVNQLRNGFGKS